MGLEDDLTNSTTTIANTITNTTSTANINDSGSEDDLSDGKSRFLLLSFIFHTVIITIYCVEESVGNPYNLSHHVHVEFHEDLGFTVWTFFS